MLSRALKNLGPQRFCQEETKRYRQVEGEGHGVKLRVADREGPFFFLPGLCNSHLQKDGHMGQARIISPTSQRPHHDLGVGF